MEDFVTFDLAKKLKEKGFTCKYPFAMYNKFGSYCPLTTSSDNVTCELVNKCRCYHEYDENDIIAPTISQVLKWLREEKEIHMCIALGELSDWVYEVSRIYGNVFCEAEDDFESYEHAALAGIEYVLDNLI